MRVWTVRSRMLFRERGMEWMLVDGAAAGSTEMVEWMIASPFI